MTDDLSFDDTPSLAEGTEENISEEQAVLDGLDKLIEDEQKEVKKKEEAKKAQDNKKEKEEFDKQELLEIFDAIMFEGEYRDTIKLGKKYSAVLRSRTVKESTDVTRKVDALDLKTFMAVQNITNVLTLAYSLVEYNGKDLSTLELKDKIKFVESLPESVIVLLSDKLFKFDRKVLAAMEEGHQNF